MAFTRFHDDPCRIIKQVQESTDPGSYYLNVPGNGLKPHYLNNSFVRLEKWGGNLSDNPVALESDLRGLTRKLTRDHIPLVKIKPISPVRHIQHGLLETSNK
jgi:hypothetical protein